MDAIFFYRNEYLHQFRSVALQPCLMAMTVLSEHPDGRLARGDVWSLTASLLTSGLWPLASGL
eukprot:1906646-Rhodomonas_salina.1